MKIAFIQTGGTIDKDYPHHINGWAFEIGDPAFVRVLKDARVNHEISFHEFCKKDSLELTKQDRGLLREFCTSLDEKAIVITHGSDTLLETAIALDGIPEKTIILVASMLPERFQNSDASFNIGMAVAGLQTLPKGIFVAIQGMIAHYRRLSRDLDSGLYMVEEES